jgi:hypothetical protein
VLGGSHSQLKIFIVAAVTHQPPLVEVTWGQTLLSVTGVMSVVLVGDPTVMSDIIGRPAGFPRVDLAICINVRDSSSQLWPTAMI